MSRKSRLTAGLLALVAAVLPDVALGKLVQAVVVGSNAGNAKLPPLEFADDDAVRWARYLSSLGVDVRLLALPDADIASRHPKWADRALTPTYANVRNAIDQSYAKAVEAQKRGEASRLYLVLIGHGTEQQGGALQLPDGILRPGDLRPASTGALTADLHLTHVVIDACNARGMTNGRGDSWSRQARSALTTREMIEERTPGWQGWVLASDTRERTFESARIRGGFFSNVLLAGLRGNADLNGDRAITYSELDAYVTIRFLGVQLTQRPQPVVLPPLDREEAVVFPGAGTIDGTVLILPSEGVGRLRVLDEQRAVLHELNFAPSHDRRSIWLPHDGHSRRLTVERYAAGKWLRAVLVIGPDVSTVPFEDLQFSPGKPLAARGSDVEQTFAEGLYALEYGAAVSAAHHAGRDQTERALAEARAVGTSALELKVAGGFGRDAGLGLLDGPLPIMSIDLLWRAHYRWRPVLRLRGGMNSPTLFGEPFPIGKTSAALGLSALLSLSPAWAIDPSITVGAEFVRWGGTSPGTVANPRIAGAIDLLYAASDRIALGLRIDGAWLGWVERVLGTPNGKHPGLRSAHAWDTSGALLLRFAP